MLISVLRRQFQGVKEFSPIQFGVSTFPGVITSTVVSLAGGLLISKLGHPQLFMVLSPIFGSIGSGFFTTFNLDTSTGKWIGFRFFTRLGRVWPP
jgi:hypothetical protein